MLILSRQIKIRKKCLISLFVLMSFNCFCQGNKIILRDSVYDILKQKSYGFECIKLDDNKLKLIYIDTFLVRNNVSPIRGFQKRDTLSITLSFEENWDSIKVNHIRFQNKEIIDPLSIKFIHFMDSISWKGVKTNKNIFKNDKVKQLRYFGFMTQFTDIEKMTLNKLKRIPDFLFLNYGVFLECKPNLFYQNIVEKEIEKIYLERLNFISNDVFKTHEIIYGKEIYE